jgi:solute carrier family 35 protein F5
MPLFFGLVGLLNVLTMWPLGAVLALTGVETPAWPGRETLGFLTANALVGTVLSDLMWAESIVLTTALVGTVGLSLTIPVALVSDALLHGARYSGVYFAGSSLVAMGFIIVAVAQRLPGADRDHLCRPGRPSRAEYVDIA